MSEYAFQERLENKWGSNLCIAKIVEVIGVDKKHWTVDIQPCVRRFHPQAEEPPILGVPITNIKNGSFIIQPNISIGDIGVAIFMDHTFDGIIETGKPTQEMIPRMHSMNDAVYIGGVVTKNDKIVNSVDTGFLISKSDGGISISLTSDKIILKNGDKTSAVFAEDSIILKSTNIVLDAEKIKNNR